MKIPFFNQDKEIDEDQIVKIEVEKISVNPFQPRKDFKQSEIEELAQSIKNFGLIQAITVRKNKENYQLIAGERRLRAAKYLDKEFIPAVIKDLNDQEMAEIALIENLQREDLDPIEEAKAYDKLIDKFDLTQAEVADSVGKSRSAVANSLRLLNLAPEVQDYVSRETIYCL